MRTIIDDEEILKAENEALQKELARKQSNTIIIVLIIAIVAMCVLFYIKNRQKSAATV